MQSFLRHYYIQYQCNSSQCNNHHMLERTQVPRHPCFSITWKIQFAWPEIDHKLLSFKFFHTMEKTNFLNLLVGPVHFPKGTAKSTETILSEAYKFWEIYSSETTLHWVLTDVNCYLSLVFRFAPSCQLPSRSPTLGAQFERVKFDWYGFVQYYAFV